MDRLAVILIELYARMKMFCLSVLCTGPLDTLERNFESFFCDV